MFLQALEAVRRVQRAVGLTLLTEEGGTRRVCEFVKAAIAVDITFPLADGRSVYSSRRWRFDAVKSFDWRLVAFIQVVVCRSVLANGN